MYLQYVADDWVPQIGDVVQVPIDYVPGYAGPIYTLGNGTPCAPAVVEDASNPSCLGLLIQFKQDLGVIYFSDPLCNLVVRGYPV